MNDATLVLALTAGLLAAVNPCGFALLPAYLSIFVLGPDQSRPQAVRRALLTAAALTTGFVGVFGIFGVVVAPLAAGVQQYLPWVTLVLGVVVALAGVWVLAGRRLPGLGWSPARAGHGRGFGSMVLFGAAYATASLTCTIAPFLAVVVASFRSGSVAGGLALFVAYGVGMGLLVGTAAVAVALARPSVLAGLRRSAGVLERVVGVLLLVTGAYVAYYGWWELQVLAGSTGSDPLISTASAAQRALADAVTMIGVRGFVGLAVLAGLISAVVRARGRRRSVPRRSR